MIGELKFNFCISHRRSLWSCALQWPTFMTQVASLLGAGKVLVEPVGFATVTMPGPWAAGKGGQVLALLTLQPWLGGLPCSLPLQRPLLCLHPGSLFPGRVAHRITQGRTSRSRCLYDHCAERLSVTSARGAPSICGACLLPGAISQGHPC